MNDLFTLLVMQKYWWWLLMMIFSSTQKLQKKKPVGIFVLFYFISLFFCLSVKDFSNNMGIHQHKTLWFMNTLQSIFYSFESMFVLQKEIEFFCICILAYLDLNPFKPLIPHKSIEIFNDRTFFFITLSLLSYGY